MIKDKQKEIYVNSRINGSSQSIASAKAGFSERTGRRIDKNEHQKGRKHDWRTRKDGFKKVWESEVVPLLEQGIDQATYLLGILQKSYGSDEYPKTLLRTLQRKIKRWKALNGKTKEVIFRQNHELGVLGVSDFTHPKNIVVTINNEPFEHIFYHFRLAHSGFNYLQVFAGSGEPYEALAQGLQEALYMLNGAPKIHRTDSLSASFKNLSKNAADDLTDRYRALGEHFGMQSTRINPGEAHENGVIESSHRHIKKRIELSLILRGSNDFSSLDEYRQFIAEVVKEHNKAHCKNFELEKSALQPLPETKGIDYKDATVIVCSTSTFQLQGVTYTVPSKLIKEKLSVRIYSDKLECFLGDTNVCTLVRGRRPARGKRTYVVNYRHVIDSLVKKPGAFAGYQLRNALLPNDDYRFIWQHVNAVMDPKARCKFIVGLLHLAASQNCEAELSCAVIDLIKKNEPLKLSDLQDRFTKKAPIPQLAVSQHSLADYNQLIPNN